MSNINTVINFIKSEPNYVKEQMVEKIMKSLNVTKSNAQVYLYNANKKLGSGTPVKTPKVKNVKSAKVSRAEIVQKSDEEIARIKEERLAQMKSIGERRVAEREAARKADLEEKQVEIDEYLEEANAYIKSLTTPTRKFLLGAE
jgi:hypothetical protein